MLFSFVTDKIISQATYLEKEYKLPLWTMMPPAVVYNGLFSRSAFFLARVCDLLLEYDISRYAKLRELGRTAQFKKERIYQQLYIADFINSLWKEVVSSFTQENYPC
jgi:hypothetical protein